MPTSFSYQTLYKHSLPLQHMQGSYEFDSIFILYVSKIIHKLVNGFFKKWCVHILDFGMILQKLTVSPLCFPKMF